MKPYLVLTTCPDSKTAESLARNLVENKLAACVHQANTGRSVYSWKGKTEATEEIQVWIKTRKPLLKKISDKILELHPYEVPEIIHLEIDGGDPRYLDWLKEETR